MKKDFRPRIIYFLSRASKPLSIDELAKELRTIRVRIQPDIRQLISVGTIKMISSDEDNIPTFSMAIPPEESISARDDTKSDLEHGVPGRFAAQADSSLGSSQVSNDSDLADIQSVSDESAHVVVNSGDDVTVVANPGDKLEASSRVGSFRRHVSRNSKTWTSSPVWLKNYPVITTSYIDQISNSLPISDKTLPTKHDAGNGGFWLEVESGFYQGSEGQSIPMGSSILISPGSIEPEIGARFFIRLHPQGIFLIKRVNSDEDVSFIKLIASDVSVQPGSGYFLVGKIVDIDHSYSF